MPNLLPYVQGVSELDQRRAQPVISVDPTGSYIDGAGKKAYSLAAGGGNTPAANVIGGDYLWAAEATAWNGATATLQILGQDGTTWRNMRNAANSADVTLTANGQVGIGVGQGSSLRVVITGGTPTAFFSNIAGL